MRAFRLQLLHWQGRHSERASYLPFHRPILPSPLPERALAGNLSTKERELYSTLGRLKAEYWGASGIDVTQNALVPLSLFVEVAVQDQDLGEISLESGHSMHLAPHTIHNARLGDVESFLRQGLVRIVR
jgi:hypothetical protein